MKWEHVNGSGSKGSEVLDCEDFFISYNPCPDSPIAEICSIMTGIPTKREETAIVKKDNYFILLGDFRTAYEAAAPLGFDACMSVFRANAHAVSPWSDHEGGVN